MTNILANILLRKQQIHDERVASGGTVSETSNRLKLKGLSAIRGGPAEWAIYMKEFANTPEELARLIPTDGSHVRGDMNDARAYLVANGPCGTGTYNRLEVGISALLDQVI